MDQIIPPSSLRPQRPKKSQAEQASLRAVSEPLRIVSLPPTPYPGRVVIVGDIHGCNIEFRELLEQKLNFKKGADQLVLVGDLVAKGPDSAGVIDTAIEYGAKSCMGNHDWTVLRWAKRATPYLPNPDASLAQRETPHTRLANNLSPDQLAYLQQMPHIIELPQYDAIVVHAGVRAVYQETPSYDCMHVRTQTEDGLLDENFDGTPWASVYPGPKFVLFGHDARRRLQKHDHACGLDTGCSYGNELTAYVFPQGELVTVTAKAQYAKGE